MIEVALCSFGEEIQTQKLRNIYFSHNWINKLFSEENKVPEHCLTLERWQGPPHINKVKQYKIALFKVSLFIHFIQ